MTCFFCTIFYSLFSQNIPSVLVSYNNDKEEFKKYSINDNKEVLLSELFKSDYLQPLIENYKINENTDDFFILDIDFDNDLDIIYWGKIARSIKNIKFFINNMSGFDVLPDISGNEIISFDYLDNCFKIQLAFYGYGINPSVFSQNFIISKQNKVFVKDTIMVFYNSKIGFFPNEFEFKKEALVVLDGCIIQPSPKTIELFDFNSDNILHKNSKGTIYSVIKDKGCTYYFGKFLNKDGDVPKFIWGWINKKNLKILPK